MPAASGARRRSETPRASSRLWLLLSSLLAVDDDKFVLAVRVAHADADARAEAGDGRARGGRACGGGGGRGRGERYADECERGVSRLLQSWCAVCQGGWGGWAMGQRTEEDERRDPRHDRPVRQLPYRVLYAQVPRLRHLRTTHRENTQRRSNNARCPGRLRARRPRSLLATARPSHLEFGPPRAALEGGRRRRSLHDVPDEKWGGAFPLLIVPWPLPLCACGSVRS